MYNIKIIMSMEVPHETWKPDVCGGGCVCVHIFVQACISVCIRGQYLFYVSSYLVEFVCHCSCCIIFVSSLLAQLPEENVTLLCHLFGVLHRIHTHSEVNQMTATNLALCIAPNMLWRSSQISPEQEGQSVLKVSQ